MRRVPNVISYSSAISACEKGGQWVQARWTPVGISTSFWSSRVQHHGLSYALIRFLAFSAALEFSRSPMLDLVTYIPLFFFGVKHHLQG